MITQLGGMPKETSMQNFGFYNGICLEGLTVDMKTSASILVGSVTNSSLTGSIGFYISQFYISGSHIFSAMILVLNFKQLVWYVNFGAWFMQNVLFEQKQIKLEINGGERCTSNNTIQSQKSLTVSLCISIKHKHSDIRHTQKPLYYL